MTMQGYAGAGLLNRKRPQFMANGFSILGLPVADLILMQARHVDGPDVTPLRFRKTNAGVVQSASLNG